MNFLKHMTENLFITFTGIAALVHSTWSLGTLFSGEMPQNDNWGLIAWGLPAFFVAFAMDIGQISTSADIRHKGLTLRRGITFFVFAVATYYLQFLYIAHHMPALAIAEGVSEWHSSAVVTARDGAIWLLPLLLPLATMLYTISDGDEKPKEKEQAPTTLIEEKSIEIKAPIILEQETVIEPSATAFCEDCGWTKSYDTSAQAARGLNTHQSLHCPAKKQAQETLISANGNLAYHGDDTTKGE